MAYTYSLLPQTKTDLNTSGSCSVLTTIIHTESYKKSKKKRHIINEYVCSCCTNLLLHLCLWCIIAGIVYSAIFAIQRIKSKKASFNIDGFCEITDIEMDSDSEGTWHWYYYKVYNDSLTTLCQSNPLAQQFAEIGRNGTVGDIVKCYTNAECDEVFVDYEIFWLNSKHIRSPGALITATIIAILSACCSLAFTLFHCTFLKGFITYANIDYRLCCDRLIGTDRKKHYVSQWIYCMNDDQKFDYFMSYCQRKYKLMLGYDTIALLCTYFESADMDYDYIP